MKDNEKRICWNCDGDVSLHLSDCPYCGSALSAALLPTEAASKELGDPFQKSPTADSFSIDEKEWERALDEAQEENKTEINSKQELLALLVFFPGVVFCLFGLLLFFFSQEGTLTLHWNKNLAYFYFLGAIPLIFLGWRGSSQRK